MCGENESYEKTRINTKDLPVFCPPQCRVYHKSLPGAKKKIFRKRLQFPYALLLQILVLL